MIDLDKVNRHFSQVRWLYSHRYRYYKLDDPIITDEEFDLGFKVCQKLEAETPELKIEDSPTQTTEAPGMGWENYFNTDREALKKRFYPFLYEGEYNERHLQTQEKREI